MIFLVFLSKASQHIVLVKTNCFKDVVNASSRFRQQTAPNFNKNKLITLYFLSLPLSSKKNPKSDEHKYPLEKKNPK